ncbi:hypothetical protein [Microseira wollei]|nr:hypothetical protein [Microseira wollei]
MGHKQLATMKLPVREQRTKKGRDRAYFSYVQQRDLHSASLSFNQLG